MTICAIFPIGICGMGKSTLCRTIRDYLATRENLRIYLFERDAIFQQFRQMHYSLRRTKAELLKYYQSKSEEIRDLNRLNPHLTIWLLFDTSNITADTREKAVHLFQPSKIWNIYLCFPSQYQSNKEQMLDFIRLRIQNRDNHPTFPMEPNEREQNILRLWNSFEKSGEMSEHFTDAEISVDIERSDEKTYMRCKWNLVEKSEELFRLLITLL